MDLTEHALQVKGKKAIVMIDAAGRPHMSKDGPTETTPDGVTYGDIAAAYGEDRRPQDDVTYGEVAAAYGEDRRPRVPKDDLTEAAQGGVTYGDVAAAYGEDSISSQSTEAAPKVFQYSDDFGESETSQAGNGEWNENAPVPVPVGSEGDAVLGSAEDAVSTDADGNSAEDVTEEGNVDTDANSEQDEPDGATDTEDDYEAAPDATAYNDDVASDANLQVNHNPSSEPQYEARDGGIYPVEDDDIVVESEFTQDKMVLAILIGTGISSGIALMAIIMGTAVYMFLHYRKRPPPIEVEFIQDEEDEAKSLVELGNIAHHATEEDIRMVFAAFGTVETVFITHEEGNHSGYVKMKTVEAAACAVAALSQNEEGWQVKISGID